MKKLLTLSIACLLLAGAAQAQLGGWLNRGVDKGTKVAEANKQWPPEYEEAIGHAAAAKLIHVFGISMDADLNRYVQMVGSTVAQYGTRKDVTYHFAVLDTDIANAFAMPGGYIFVTR